MTNERDCAIMASTDPVQTVAPEKEETRLLSTYLISAWKDEGRRRSPTN